MERSLISFSVPNMITVWLMLAIGFLAVALVIQLAGRAIGGSASSDNSGGGGY